MRAILIAAVALLVGCSVTSNMTQIGPNRYQGEVTWGGSAGADWYAKDAAAKKCASLGETLAELSTVTGHDDDPDHATFTFECH